MNNKYVTEILKEYERLQDISKTEQRQRQEEVYQRFPRIRAIDEQISRMGYEIASAIFKGIDIESYIANQRAKITDLKIEKAEILSAHNYPVDYLEIRYKCNICKDTGYAGNQRCSCFKQRIIDRHYNQSNLRNILKQENFDNFDFSLYSSEKYKNQPSSPRKNIEQIFTKCIGFSQNFDTVNENLFFFGNSGLGKTFLSNCIAKELLDRGKVVIYQTASNLIQIFRSLRFEENSSENQIEEFLNCDLLVIDDLGTEPNTPYSQSELFNIINTRILTNKKMIISTNLPLEEIHSHYPERITSRIYGNFAMSEFYGDDIRIIKKNINNRKARA